MANVFLFFDDFILAHYKNVHRRFMSPEFKDEGTYPQGDWLITVDYIPSDNLYRMWHRMWLDLPGHRLRPDTRFTPVMAMARSEDGIHWLPARLSPDVDKLTHKERATCFSGVSFCDEFHVFHDMNDEVYKTAYADKDECGNPAMWLAISDDGVHWETRRTHWLDSPIWSDTQNSLLYNPITQKYQIMCRRSFVDRRIAVVESRDLVDWSKPRVILHPDPFDVPCGEFYSLPIFYYDGIFIGLLNLYFPDGSKYEKPAYHGSVITELVYSYNGLNWNRTHRIILNRRPSGTLGAGQIYGSHLMLDPRTEQVYIYAYGALKKHGIGGPTGILLYTLRKDGFVCLESSSEQGYIQTKPFILDAPDVSLNISAPHGGVKIQISNINSNPYVGFTFDDFNEWRGDSLAISLSWRGHDLSELVGRAVSFEFLLNNAQVYAIRGSLRPFHAADPLDGYG